MSLIKTCHECKGTGEVFNDEPDESVFVTCENCNGEGQVFANEEVEKDEKSNKEKG